MLKILQFSNNLQISFHYFIFLTLNVDCRMKKIFLKKHSKMYNEINISHNLSQRSYFK